MYEIKLDKSNLIKKFFRNMFYLLFKIIFMIKIKTIILKDNKKIKIRIKSVLDYKFFYQKNNKIKLINNFFVYEEQETNKIIQNSNKKNIFIDLGSHHGYFSFVSSAFFEHVFSVESSKIFYKNQLRIKKENIINNLTIINKAIGDGSELVYQDYLSKTVSKSISLTQLLSSNKIKEKIFLKVDINGFEKFCLDELSESKKLNIDKILIDIYLNKIFTRAELLSSLKLVLLNFRNIEVLFHIKNKINNFIDYDIKNIENIFKNKDHDIITIYLSN